MTDYYDNGGNTEDFKLVRSKKVSGAVAVGTHSVVRIPKGAFLKDVWLETTETLVPGTALALTVGFTGNKETADADYFLINADVGAGAVGIYRASQAATPFEGKRFLDSSGTITLTLGSGSNLTAGAFRVLAEYSILWG